MTLTVATYVLYYFFYSAVGWLVESIYCSVPAKKWINRGFLTGPMCPIYGTGAVALALLLTPLRDKPLLVCLVGMVITDVVEFFTSLIMEKLFHARWWDYSDQKFNLQGRICLRHTLYWGLATMIFMYGVHPVVEKVFVKIPENIIYIVLGVILFVFLLDVFNAVRNALDIKKFMDRLHRLSEKITAKYEELQAKLTGRDTPPDTAGDVTSEVDETLDEFSNKTRRRQKKGEPHTNRLFRGFPSLEEDARTQLEKMQEYLRNAKRHIMDDEEERY